MSQQFDSTYTHYQLDRSWLRKQVRQLYLRKAASLVSGPTLDFGCGVGELLRLLPPGSQGLEYNKATVEHCQSHGLHVQYYDGFADDWAMSVLTDGTRFESMVISHVLEHLDDPVDKFRKLLAAARPLGIRNVLVIVPGQAGFQFDPTHLTFVDQDMLIAAVAGTDFTVEHAAYYPGNTRGIGDWFTYHELQMVFVRSS